MSNHTEPGSIDLSGLQGAVDNACAVIDKLRADNRRLLRALDDCIEHMEWSTPQGDEAHGRAEALIVELSDEHQVSEGQS